MIQEQSESKISYNQLVRTLKNDVDKVYGRLGQGRLPHDIYADFQKREMARLNSGSPVLLEDLGFTKPVINAWRRVGVRTEEGAREFLETGRVPHGIGIGRLKQIAEKLGISEQSTPLDSS